MTEEELAQALAEYHDRRMAGETIDADAFCREHGDDTGELRRAIAALDGIDVDLDHAAADEALPETLSGCRILRRLGSGGMGTVYLARDERLRRDVAIKTLRRELAADPTVRERFLGEARALARIAHPNVVRIFALGREGEPPHFVMEYIEGEPLARAAAEWPLRRRVEVFRKVAAAVAHLHRNGLLHRDLKPSNILVDARGEPHLLDLGLALPLDEARRLTLPGGAVGTPAYWAPEQAAGGPLDARTDVYGLGVVLYELITGALPAPGAPELPRRLSPSVDGDLQRICLKALERAPEDRYPTVQAFVEDLDRYLAGEPVLAQPSSSAQLIESRRAGHMAEISAWLEAGLISQNEFEALRRGYRRLEEREDAWLLEMRRLSLVNVTLYFGLWLMAAASAIIAVLADSGLPNLPAALAVAAAAAAALWTGLRLWNRGERRSGIAFLLAFCAMLPLALALLEAAAGVAAKGVEGREWLAGEGWRTITNAQLWWALAASLPVFFWLRRSTGSSAFSMAMAAGAAALSLVTLLRMGWLEWLEKDPGKLYFRLLPFALLFFVLGFTLERRRLPLDSRYFYPFAVAFTYAGLSGIALFHKPYQEWLQAAFPWTRGQVEYLFLANAAAYSILQWIADRLPAEQMHMTARAFRFVLPGHVLISLLLLSISAAEGAELHGEKILFDELLTAAAAAFVFLSIPKQMKNFLASGLLFLAVGLVRLQQDVLRGAGWWPLLVLASGMAAMLAAARYPALARILRRG